MDIFAKIAAGEIPSYKCAENEEFYAFLDINPLVKGHTLVIPRREVDYFFDMDDATNWLVISSLQSAWPWPSRRRSPVRKWLRWCWDWKWPTHIFTSSRCRVRPMPTSVVRS